MNKENQRDAYNRYFKEYDVQVQHIHNMLKPYTIDIWKNYCVDKDILEIGCGTAYVLNELLSCGIKFKTYTGIDISDEMIKNNKRLYNADNINFIIDDAENPTNINKSFDIVISYGCLHHLEHPEKAVKNIFEKLKNNGRLFAVELNRKYYEQSFIGFYSSILGLNFKIDNRIDYTNPYVRHHPGHPGKRSPEEYRDILKNFSNQTINGLYVTLFPERLFNYSNNIFRLMVYLSRFLEKTNNIGSVLLIEAKK